MRVVDTVALDEESVRITADGYLVADARIARTGIQTYLASELGMKDAQPGQVIRVLRSADEVFDKASMASIAWRPLTNDHPKDMVTAKTWRRDAIGQLGDAVKRETAQDGEYIRVPLTMMDGDAISQYRAGKRELSVGYTCDVDWTPGVTDGGEAYDARQTNIRANHLALVHRGRAGSACRIGDSWPHRDDDAHPVKDKSMTLKTILVDSLQVETTDAGEAAIKKLLGDNAALKDAAAKADAAHALAIKAKDEQIAKLDAEVATLKGQVLTGDALDKAIAARGKLIGDAKKIAGEALVTDGKSDAEIKKAAVLAKLGDTYAGRDATFFDHAFEIQLAQVGDSSTQRNHLADAIGAGAGAIIGDAAEQAAKAARASYMAALRGEKA
ncbi:MAG: DUF2213 domain-containing protein [Caulobacter sp.]|nr:DUF2213 domain-containing protein [Caulobacter sp.]